MTTSTNPTTSTSSELSIPSLIKDIHPWSDDHPYSDLWGSLRQLHSTLDVLRRYTNDYLTSDPIDVNVTNVLEVIVAMAACSRDHAYRLEVKLVAASRQLKEIAEQFGKEVQP